MKNRKFVKKTELFRCPYKLYEFFDDPDSVLKFYQKFKIEDLLYL